MHFTTAYCPLAELDAAFEHRQFLHKLDNSRTQSRMWHRAITVSGGVDVGERRLRATHPVGPDLDESHMGRRDAGLDLRLVPKVLALDRVAPLLDACEVGLGKCHGDNAIEVAAVRGEHLSE